jgi:tRNA threonylcarbamoyladenosine biosynthesis protein TsaB
MTVLGIETSTAVCGVGVQVDGGESVERSLVESHIHSEKLLTLVQDALAEARLSLRQIDAVAVSMGPGSFTGLRIGLSTAKGLSYSLDCPLIAVPTFEAIAEAVRTVNAPVREIVVVMDARQGEFYTGRYRVTAAGKIEIVDDVRVMRLEDAGALIPTEGEVLVVTDALPLVRSAVRQEVAVEDVHPYCRGGVVASVGRRKLAANELADTALLEPLYLKDFVVKSVEPINKKTKSRSDLRS